MDSDLNNKTEAPKQSVDHRNHIYRLSAVKKSASQHSSQAPLALAPAQELIPSLEELQTIFHHTSARAPPIGPTVPRSAPQRLDRSAVQPSRDRSIIQRKSRLKLFASEPAPQSQPRPFFLILNLSPHLARKSVRQVPYPPRSAPENGQRNLVRRNSKLSLDNPPDQTWQSPSC